MHTAATEGWSRAALELQINAKAHIRQGKALTNFANLMRHPEDKPTIGLLLCREKKKECDH